MPVERRQSVVLPFHVDDDAWSRIVVELRSVFKARGLATEVGAIREWISDARDQRSPVRVTAEPESDATRITFERSTWSQTLGVGAGTSSLLLTALILFSIALVSGKGDLLIPAVLMTTVGLLISAGLFTGTRIVARRDKDRFNVAVRRIRQIGSERTDEQLQVTTGNLTEPSRDHPKLSIDDEQPSSSPKEPTLRRRRER